ncbi:hypothetical protein [Sebaldella sp. S0638]|nr:hypothetical protein [Sebaldella sp. S0638]
MKKVTILLFFTTISAATITLYEYKREFREDLKGRRSDVSSI